MTTASGTWNRLQRGQWVLHRSQWQLTYSTLAATTTLGHRQRRHRRRNRRRRLRRPHQPRGIRLRPRSHRRIVSQRHLHSARQVHRQVPLHPPCHPGSHRPCLHGLDINRSRHLDRRHRRNRLTNRHRHGRRSRNRRSHRHRYPSAHSTQTLHPSPRPVIHSNLTINDLNPSPPYPNQTPMKHKTTIVASPFSAWLAVSANAANIIWQGPQAISASTDVSTQGTLFTAKSTGYDYTREWRVL